MIELQDIRKSYFRGGNEVPVLRGVSLQCAPGASLSLMGASGAGKSTLLQILGCLDAPTGGAYRFDGEDVAGLDEDALARVRNRRIGFVFQNSYFVDYLDLVDNVALPALYGRGRIQPADRERARALLAEVGLASRVEHLPAALSGGERQRAALARALFNDPELLLADEPTGNLDADNAEIVLSLLFNLSGRRSALVVVTHDPAVAARAMRRYRLESGRLEIDADLAA